MEITGRTLRSIEIKNSCQNYALLAEIKNSHSFGWIDLLYLYLSTQ